MDRGTEKEEFQMADLKFENMGIVDLIFEKWRISDWKFQI